MKLPGYPATGNTGQQIIIQGLQNGSPVQLQQAAFLMHHPFVRIALRAVFGKGGGPRLQHHGGMAFASRRTVKTAPERHRIKQPPHGRRCRAMNMPLHHRFQSLPLPGRNSVLQTPEQSIRPPLSHLPGQGAGAAGGLLHRFIPTGQQKRPDPRHPFGSTLLLHDKKLTTPHRSIRAEPRSVPGYAQGGERSSILCGAGKHMRLMMLYGKNGNTPFPGQTPGEGCRRVIRMGVHGNHIRHGLQGTSQNFHRPLKSVQGGGAVQIPQMLAHHGHAILQPANGIFQPGAESQHLRRLRRGAPYRPGRITAGPAHHHGSATRHAHHGIIHRTHDRPVVHEKHVRRVLQLLQRLFHGNAQRLPAQIAAGHHERLSPHIHQQRMHRGRRQHNTGKTAEHAYGRR